MVLIIGLILIGIVLLILEIIILPGMIAGIIGSLFLLIAILWMYASQGETAGHITLVSTVITTFLAIYFSLKSRAWKRYGLHETISSKVNDVEILNIQEGDEGRTLSALRPSGTVLIGESKVEAQTNGEMIDVGTKVIVTKVLPNKLLVKIKVSEL